MQTRTLAQTGHQVAPLMLGGNVFGWTIDEKQSFQILDAFTDRGFNFIDTADVYSRWKPGNRGGESEDILGAWFTRTGLREKVVLATKVGMDLGGDQKGLSRRHILTAVEASLERLQTDYIDLYQSHIDDEKVPLDETLEAYAQLIQQGKVRAIGASNYSGPRLREAVGPRQTRRPPRLPDPPTRVQPLRPPEVRDRPATRLPGTRHRRSPLLLPRQRLPHWQVQDQGRRRRQEPRLPRREVLRRPRHEDPQSPRRSLAANRSQTGKHRPRLADGPTHHPRPHRQRHHPRPARRPHRRRHPHPPTRGPSST